MNKGLAKNEYVCRTFTKDCEPTGYVEKKIDFETCSAMTRDKRFFIILLVFKLCFLMYQTVATNF